MVAEAGFLVALHAGEAVAGRVGVEGGGGGAVGGGAEGGELLVGEEVLVVVELEGDGAEMVLDGEAKLASGFG